MKKQATAIPEDAVAVTAIPSIRILKIGNCPSLSGKSTLTYHIGCTADGALVMRTAGNTGVGFFNNDWVSLADIQKLLANVPSGKTITSFALHEIYSGKSTNSAAFLFSALMKEGLVQPAKDKKRCYELTTDAAAKFFADVKGLMDSGADIKVVEKVAKATSKAPKSDAKAAKSMPKKEPVEVKTEAVAAIPPAATGQQFETISKQPWPIKEKVSKAASKKV